MLKFRIFKLWFFKFMNSWIFKFIIMWTPAQLSISAYLIIISDDKLGPQSVIIIGLIRTIFKLWFLKFMNFQIHNHVDTGQAYDLIVTLIKFKLELRDRVWPCSAIACFSLIFRFITFTLSLNFSCFFSFFSFFQS